MNWKRMFFATAASLLLFAGYGSAGHDSTSGAFLDHFQCYEIRPSPPFAPFGVVLVDQFNSPGGAFVTVKKPRSVCAPASKNDEDPDAVADPAHLTAYRVGRPSPKFQKVSNQEIVNQFVRAVTEWTRADVFDDDLTLVVVKGT